MQIFDFGNFGLLDILSVKDIDLNKLFVKLYFLTSAISSIITGQYSTKLPIPVEAILECLTTLTKISVDNYYNKLKISNKFYIDTIIYKSSIIIENVFNVLNALLKWYLI